MTKTVAELTAYFAVPDMEPEGVLGGVYRVETGGKVEIGPGGSRYQVATLYDYTGTVQVFVPLAFWSAVPLTEHGRYAMRFTIETDEEGEPQPVAFPWETINVDWRFSFELLPCGPAASWEDLEALVELANGMESPLCQDLLHDLFGNDLFAREFVSMRLNDVREFGGEEGLLVRGLERAGGIASVADMLGQSPEAADAAILAALFQDFYEGIESSSWTGKDVLRTARHGMLRRILDGAFREMDYTDPELSAVVKEYYKSPERSVWRAVTAGYMAGIASPRSRARVLEDGQRP